MHSWFARTSILAVLFAGLLLAACAPTAEIPVATASPTAIPTQPVVTPSATTDWFPATATPTLLPSPVYSPTPELVTDLGVTLVSDTFTNSKDWVTGKTAAGSVAFGQGELTLAVSAPKGYLYSLRNNTSLSNFYLEINVSPSLCRGADSYGLLLRASDAPSSYRFILTCAGQLRLERVTNGNVAVVQDWLPRVGDPVVARVSVWASGSEMRFFVNDEYQFSARDPLLTSGSLGVFARASGASALTVNFSNLNVRAVGELSQFPPPTLPPNKKIPLAPSPFPTP